jgi:DNA-binding transcriptional LysR family regulator
MLDDIAELRTFVRIVAAGSLSAAGREMGLALSVVSKRLANLERRLDTRLLARSTRHLALTDEGRDLFHRAQRILAEIDEAEAALSHGRVEVRGILRISAPAAFGRAHIVPVCAELVSAHPKLSVDLVLTDRLTNLIDESLDVVVRIGEPKESGLVMRKLADNHRILVATTDYLARRGRPAHPDDLAAHDCLLFGTGIGLWRLVGPKGETVEPAVSGRLRSNSGEAAYDWALSGHGIILKSSIDVEADLRADRVVRVLPDWQSEPAPICALFPSNRQLPNRVRLFLDAMAEHLRRASFGG